MFFISWLMFYSPFFEKVFFDFRVFQPDYWRYAYFFSSNHKLKLVEFSPLTFFFLFEFQGRLYVLVDVSQMNDSGSKEAFVSLLEYAEEVLECSDVIVCFQKCQSSNTKTAIRNFLFLGFQPLAPGHEYLPTNPNLVNTILLKVSQNTILLKVSQI